MSLRFVVVGTGRSGTKFASEVFCRLGIPCGHEALFSETAGAASGLVGDASFGIVPALASFGGVVFHQTRHPLAVVRSIASTGFFTSPGRYEPYLELMTRTVPDLADRADPLRKAMHYVVRWNLMIEPFARLRWRVEDLGPNVLAAATHLVGFPRSALDCAAALRAVPADTNSLERGGVARLPLEWSDLEQSPEKLALAELATRYGYEP